MKKYKPNAVYTCLLVGGERVRVHGNTEEPVEAIRARCEKKHGPMVDVLDEERMGREAQGGPIPTRHL
jgi:hypothetical protein